MEEKQDDLRERLRREVRDAKDEMQSLSWTLSDLASSINNFNDNQFFEDDAKRVFEAYKRDLERQNLWNKELDEHYDLFMKFDLPRIL